MPFTVNDFMDLLRMLEEHPHWRLELRKLLLSDELLALPDVVRQLAEEQRALTQQVRQLAEEQMALARQVRELAEGQQALAEGQRALAEEQTALTRQVRELAGKVDALTEQMKALTNQVNSLVTWQRGEAGRRDGERYERNTIKDAPYIFAGGRGGATDAPHVQEKLVNWLRKIFEEGKELKQEERPTLADLIWWKDERVAVVEISIKVNGADVRRAYSRAKTLRSVGVDAFPVVIGENWSSIEAREFAKENGVEWVVNGIPSEGVIAFRRMPY